jgi:phospholipase/lecithinase/hemolysin
MSNARTLLGWLVFASLASAVSHPAYQRLYVFGDSYSDIGAGYLDGDGPTAVVYLAQQLGLQLLPSNAPDIAGASLDFAVSGARTGEGAGSKVEGAWLGYGMQNQVNDFAALVRSRKISFEPKKTLFFIAGGLNDSKLSTEITVTNLENEIRTLYGLGARHFSLALLPTAIPNFSAVGRRLNPALTLIPQQLAHDLPKAKITLSHWGLFFDEVMNNPTPYGIHNTTDACAGRGIFHQDPTPCTSPADHFYYHAGHPSTAVHKIVGEKLYRELIAPPPPDAGREPATHR